MTDEPKRYCTYCDKNVQSLGGRCPDCGNRTWETQPAQSHEHSQVLQESAWNLGRAEGIRLGAERERAKICAFLYDHDPYWAEIIERGDHLFQDGVNL